VPLMLFLERLEFGRVASEEVVLELVKCKCLPILLYGLECCPLNKSRPNVTSLDFAVTRFLMKLFKSVKLNQRISVLFQLFATSELLEKGIAKFQKRFEGIEGNYIDHIIRYFGKKIS